MKIFNPQIFLKLLFIGFVLLSNCKPEELLKVTKLRTGEIADITATTAKATATFIDIGGSVKEYGHCLNTAGNPTIDDNKFIVSATAKKGDYTSNLSNLSGATKYFVRAFAQDADQTIYGDEINFTTLDAPYIGITSPQTGNTWIRGETKTITWEDNIDEKVDIELLKGIASLGKIINNTVSDGSEIWTIPIEITQGIDYSIKITSVSNTSVYSQTGWFKLEDPSINIIAPATGDYWLGGETQNILWEDNLDGNIDIELFKGTSSLGKITSNITSNGSFSWIIPAGYEETSYSIKIISSTNANIFKESQSFTLSDPYIGVNIPSTNTNWPVGESCTITWNDNIYENVNIILYKNGISDRIIISNSSSDGEYSWLIPENLMLGVDYKIRVESINNTDLFGESPDFVISEKSGSEGTITDIENHTYKTIKIGGQWWMAENLKTTRYNNNAAIDYPGTNNTAWQNNVNGAYAWNQNDETSYKSTYGALYNWFAVNSENLCPTGWHVPSDDEWKILINYLAGAEIAGGKLKETGTIHWASPNTGATNETGFTALPGGHRVDYGDFYQFGKMGFWWSKTEIDLGTSWDRYLSYDKISIGGGAGMFGKNAGLSIRCIKD